MSLPPPTENRPRTLRAIKAVHTVVWAFFAGCIVAMPIASWLGRHRTALWLAGIVLLEVAVLLVNRRECPLSVVAARYTADRRPNFDIYLPEWVARHNHVIFGWLYGAGLIFTLIHWWLNR